MEERNNNVVTAVIITVLVMVVLGLVGFIVYDKVTNKTNEPNSEENNNDNNEVKEISINDSLITSLKYPMDNFSVGYKKQWDYKNVTIDDLSRADMMYTASVGLSYTEGISINGNPASIYSAKAIENNFKKIFGPDILYKNGDIENGKNPCSYISDYDETKDVYVADHGCGADTVGYTDRISKKYKAEETSEYIYVYEYVQSVRVRPENENDYNSEPAAYLLDNNDKETTQIDYDNYENTIYSMIDKGEVDTYKWTFKKQSDGKYYFYSGAWEN